MALQFNRTDTATGHEFTVYARIDNAVIIIGQSSNITLNLYDSAEAAGQGLDPVLPPDIIILLPDDMTALNSAFVTGLAVAVQAGKVNSPLDALKTALYTLVKARPTYNAAVSV